MMALDSIKSNNVAHACVINLNNSLSTFFRKREDVEWFGILLMQSKRFNPSSLAIFSKRRPERFKRLLYNSKKTWLKFPYVFLEKFENFSGNFASKNTFSTKL